MSRDVHASAIARDRIFASSEFHGEVADRLGHPTADIASILDALSPALSQLPLNDNAAALAGAGASILMAVCSRQRKAAAIRRATARLLAMPYRFEVGAPAEMPPVPNIMRELSGETFGADVAQLLRNLWVASRGTTAAGFRPTELSVTWGDQNGSVLHGVIEQWSCRRKKLYSSAELQAPSLFEWNFVEVPSVGGCLIAPISLVGFAAILDDYTDGTDASIDADLLDANRHHQ